MPSLKAPHEAGSDRFYGRRKGRPLRAGRAGLMETLLPRLQIALPETRPLNLAALFKSPSGESPQIWLEIGFGGGEHLAAQAVANPHIGLIGCEPFVNGVAKLLNQIESAKLENIRIFADDARFLLDSLPDSSVTRVFVQYPDPWPKKRHAERRFIGRPNLDRLARVMAPNGELRLATDVDALADWMREQTQAHAAFAPVYDGHTPPADWVQTRYEQKGLAAGRTPTYLIFRKHDFLLKD